MRPRGCLAVLFRWLSLGLTRSHLSPFSITMVSAMILSRIGRDHLHHAGPLCNPFEAGEKAIHEKSWVLRVVQPRLRRRHRGYTPRRRPIHPAWRRSLCPSIWRC